MRVKEFICHTLNALLGGIAGGALGVGIAWGICQLWLALDIWPFDSSSWRGPGVPIPAYAAMVACILFLVCPLYLGKLGVKSAVQRRWPFHKKTG